MRRYQAYEREPADTEVAETWRMPEMDIEGHMPSSVELTIGEPKRLTPLPSAGTSPLGKGVEGLKSNLPLIAGVGLIGIAAYMALVGGGKKRSFAGHRRGHRSAMNGFVSEHPWMTFFLASAAISGIVSVATSVTKPTDSRLPFQISGYR